MRREVCRQGGGKVLLAGDGNNLNLAAAFRNGRASCTARVALALPSRATSIFCQPEGVCPRRHDQQGPPLNKASSKMPPQAEQFLLGVENSHVMNADPGC